MFYAFSVMCHDELFDRGGDGQQDFSRFRYWSGLDDGQEVPDSLAHSRVVGDFAEYGQIAASLMNR